MLFVKEAGSLLHDLWAPGHHRNYILLDLTLDTVIKCHIMTLIQDLEKYRLEHKITQEQLAKKLGVAFATVNRWLNGKYKPRKIQQYHIEKLLRRK